MNDPWPLTGQPDLIPPSPPDPLPPLIEPKHFDPLELLTVADLARLFKRSRASVVRLVDQGKLSPVAFDDGSKDRREEARQKRYRFTRESVEQALRELTAAWLNLPPAEGGPKPLPRRPLPVNLRKLWDGKSRL